MEKNLSKHTPCSCGGKPCRCEGACDCDVCALQCLERPRYFSGQQIDETDLNALVTWARGRFALQRFHHGWGVVSGLHVHAECGNVILSPGYAITCCGDGIVVCEEQKIDLFKRCCVRPAGCEDPQNVHGEHDLRVFDLVLEYHEQPARPKVRTGRGQCHTTQCEPTRISESGRLVCREVKREIQVKGDGVWAIEVGRLHDFAHMIESLAGDTEAPKGTTDIERALRDAIRHPTPAHFPSAWDAVRRDLSAAKDSRVRVRLIHDRIYWLKKRMGWLDKASWNVCRPSDGIVLGRVWLVTDANGKWAIECIDTAPPHRRTLRADRPALTTAIGTALLLPESEAITLLHEQGIATATVSTPAAGWSQTLSAMSAIDGATTKVTLHLANVSGEAARVLAITPEK